MKKALQAYSDLRDIVIYSSENWLRLELTDRDHDEITYLTAATAFLLDNLFFKEGVGSELTEEAKSDFNGEFEANKLGETATDLRLSMIGNTFEARTSEFKKYWNWIIETEEYLKEGLKDNHGLLPLAYVDALVDLVLKDHKDEISTRVSEIMFLNVISCFCSIYKEAYGTKRFKLLSSYPFFEGVEDAMENIRKENAD